MGTGPVFSRDGIYLGVRDLAHLGRCITLATAAEAAGWPDEGRVIDDSGAAPRGAVHLSPTAAAEARRVILEALEWPADSANAPADIYRAAAVEIAELREEVAAKREAHEARARALEAAEDRAKSAEAERDAAFKERDEAVKEWSAAERDARRSLWFYATLVEGDDREMRARPATSSPRSGRT